MCNNNGLYTQLQCTPMKKFGLRDNGNHEATAGLYSGIQIRKHINLRGIV